MAIQTPTPKAAPAKPVVSKPAVAAPAKPAPAKPVAAAKPAAPAKPAAAKPAPAAKPAAAPPTKANGFAKPAAVPPAAAPAAKPAPASVSKADYDKLVAEFAEFQKGVTEYLGTVEQRLSHLELAGLGPHVSLDENGAFVLDLDNADEDTIRNWAYQFNVCDWNADAESIRATLKKTRSAKNFQGWVAVNALPRPAAEGEAPAEAAPADDGEGQTVTEEDIAKMNWTELADLAGQVGIDYSDIQKPQQPKVLRQRVLEYMKANMVASEEEPTAPADDDGGTPIGTPIVVTGEDGTQYSGTFQGVDGDGAVLVTWDADGSQAAVPSEAVSLPG